MKNDKERRFVRQNRVLYVDSCSKHIGCNMKIDIRDNISDELAIELVSAVIKRGKISKKGDKMYYCWVTKMTYADEDYTVYVKDNRKTDCFVVTKG